MLNSRHSCNFRFLLLEMILNRSLAGYNYSQLLCNSNLLDNDAIIMNIITIRCGIKIMMRAVELKHQQTLPLRNSLSI